MTSRECQQADETEHASLDWRYNYFFYLHTYKRDDQVRGFYESYAILKEERGASTVPIEPVW